MTKNDDAGFTLVEVLLALLILGTAIGALVATMGSAANNSRTHRDLVTQDTVMRSYVEAVKESVRATCPGGDFSVTYTPPSGYDDPRPYTDSTACPSTTEATIITATVVGPAGIKSMQIAVRLP